MKNQQNMKMIVGFMIGLLCYQAIANEMTISDVVARQRWPWNRLVDIDYVLDCDPSETADIQLTAKNGLMDLDIPPEALAGDLNGVKTGARRITLDPTKTAYTNSQILTRFSVSLTPSACACIHDCRYHKKRRKFRSDRVCVY